MEMNNASNNQKSDEG
jgi:hypothetical protein